MIFFILFTKKYVLICQWYFDPENSWVLQNCLKKSWPKARLNYAIESVNHYIFYIFIHFFCGAVLNEYDWDNFTGTLFYSVKTISASTI